MSKQNQAKQLKSIILDIKKVAKALEIQPALLTKAKYYSGGGTIGDWELRKFGGINAIIKANFPADFDRDWALVTDQNEVRRTSQQLQRALGDQELFLKRLQESVSKIKPLKLKPYASKKSHKDEARTVNLTLSDLHIGSDLTKEENGYAFGVVEESRALARVIENVIDYKRQYRDSTDLVINILGDIIQNELHGRTSSDLLHIQTCRAIWLLQQAIARCAEHYKKVHVNFVPGNHGRDTAIHQTRAIHMKFNALETTVYYAVKIALQHMPNITFSQPKTPWVEYTSQGHRIYATHGDTHLNPGNPGKSVDIGRLENQINKINASLKDSEEYRVFICGHVHLPLITELPNGAYLVVNGALTPPDSFAQSLNIMESRQVQVLFESTSKHPVGDMRFINVNGTGSISELDKIITPFKGL